MSWAIDGRPLQGASSLRGIGSYTRGLLGGIAALGRGGEVRLLLAPGSEPPEGAAWGLRPARTRLPAIHPTLQPWLDPLTVSVALRRERPRLYHGVEYAQPLAASVPVVMTVHDLIPTLFPQWYPWVRRSQLLAVRLLRRADAVIAVSEATAADVVRLARVRGERVTVIPEGVDPQFRPASVKISEPVLQRLALRRPFVLGVGTFDPRKRIDHLAEVVRRLRQTHDLELVIAGDQSTLSARVDAALRDAGIAEHTRLLGHVHPADLVALYSAAACLLFTSAYEGFGLPPLEAMACATPVVAFANSSIPEVTGDAAWLVEDGDVAAMAAAARRLLDDDAERARRAALGVRRAAAFTWRSAAERTLDVYASLQR